MPGVLGNLCPNLWAPGARASELHGGVLVGAAGDGPGALEGHGALDDDVGGEGDVALDDDLLAADEGGHAVRRHRLHRVHELVLAVELHVGRDAAAGRRELDAAVGRQHVGVGAEREEVAGGLHGREARARDHDGGGPLEALDRRAHRRLELEHLRGLLVPGVHGLGVLHDGQGQGAAVLLELRLEGLEVHPEVVGVEVLVLLGVLELLLVLLGALRRLAQEEAPRRGLAGEVAALLVGVRAPGHLHHEGGLRLGEVREELQVHHGAQVVRVRDEHVLEALRQELLQRAAAEHRRVEVAVPRRAPLVRGVLRPGRRREVRLRHLRRLVLHELEVVPRAEVRVLREEGEGVGRRGEGVHEQEGEVRLEALAHHLHLLGDEVQERVAARDLQQRLGLVEAHARAEAAVQLQHHRRFQERRVRGHVQLLELGEAVHRREGAVGDHRVGAGREHAEVVLEGGDGRRVEPLLGQLLVVLLPERLLLRRRQSHCCGGVRGGGRGAPQRVDLGPGARA
mmetsp:Transcript_115879/g.328408  ORF Transcript_115879/g.328408 Transcript_115879/m.328408 type:complete len:511 (+) Transcript_115879:198-1730(+)